MGSYLIKDTTREDREKIVMEFHARYESGMEVVE